MFLYSLLNLIEKPLPNFITHKLEKIPDVTDMTFYIFLNINLLLRKKQHTKIRRNLIKNNK